MAETAPADAPAYGASSPPYENGHSHGHDDPNLAHHFEDLGQQRSSATLGMWAFLGTEVMFFGGLIGSSLIYRFTSPDIWAAASKQLNVTIATINTIVLLTSSLSMAFAVHAGATGDRRKQVRFLLITAGLGLLFMAFKAVEYKQDWDENLIPGPNFSTEHIHLPDESDPGALGSEHGSEAATTRHTSSILTITPAEFVRRRAQMFFVFYFFMTGLHLLHMVVGLGLVTWVLALARRGRFTASYHTPLEMVGLYWHFIDIVWVFLYPLLYLVALHK